MRALDDEIIRGQIVVSKTEIGFFVNLVVIVGKDGPQELVLAFHEVLRFVDKALVRRLVELLQSFAHFLLLVCDSSGDLGRLVGREVVDVLIEGRHVALHVVY